LWSGRRGRERLRKRARERVRERDSRVIVCEFRNLQVGLSSRRREREREDEKMKKDE